MAGFVHRRAQALTREFKQAKARDAADLHAGAVNFRRLVQAVFHVFAVAADAHVNEIYDNQPAQVAQAHLSRDFICCFQVGLVGGFFDVAAFGRLGGVNINGNQRFGVVNDQLAAGRQLYVALVGRLNLPFNLIAGEERDIILI